MLLSALQVEEEAEEEVNKVLEEVAGDIMASMPGAPAKVRGDAIVVGTAGAVRGRMCESRRRGMPARICSVGRRRRWSRCRRPCSSGCNGYGRKGREDSRCCVELRETPERRGCAQRDFACLSVSERR